MHRSFVAGTVLLLLSCKMLGNKEEGAPAASAAAAGSQSAPAASVATAAEPAAAADGFEFMPLAVGHFVEYRQKHGAAFERYAWAVIGEEGGSFWLQLISNMKEGQATMHMLMKVKTAADINAAQPEKMRFKVPGRGVQEISGQMLAMAASRRPTEGVMVDMDPAAIRRSPTEDVTVPAGTLGGAFRWVGTTKWKGKKNKTTFWSHPKVPITGIVKGDDGTRTWELVKYGTSGAKDELQ